MGPDGNLETRWGHFWQFGQNPSWTVIFCLPKNRPIALFNFSWQPNCSSLADERDASVFKRAMLKFETFNVLLNKVGGR